METTKPPSPTTALSDLRAAAGKLPSLSLVQGLLRIAPRLPAAALAGLVILCFAWSCEHRARQRAAEEARQVRKQAAEQISQLEKQAASALRDAQQSSQAARELDGQRQQLALQADGLRQNLDTLRTQELAHASALAGLTTDEVVKRVTERLQEQGFGKQTVNSLTRPATADDNAVARHPLPQGGEGTGTSAGTVAAAGTGNVRGEGPSAAPPASPSAAPSAMELSDDGVRKVESAFLELDSCRQQSQVIEQQVSNCEQRAKVDSALEAQQAGTISKLNAALADKDQILARREAAYRAELKAARGSWRSRFYHAVGIFAGGFIAGVLVR